jgi:DNA integrity scanning protein DisA with diadenylate cyclase activity
MIGSTNFATKRNFLKHFKFLKQDAISATTDVDSIIGACERMGITKTGAIIVIERNNSLDFVKSTGDAMNIQVTQPILESIFFKNSPLHDGAIVIQDNFITATRVILPVSNDRNIPLRFGLRHRAAVGITEKTDAVCLVVSEETGSISYIKNGEFVPFKGTEELTQLIKKDLEL